jgi:cellulase/cellobiase CelA1
MPIKNLFLLFALVLLLVSCFDSGTYVEETTQSSSSMLSSSSELSSSIIADNPESPSYSFRLVQEEADSNDGNWQVNDTLYFAIESDSLEDYSCRWELDGRVLADSACDLTLAIEEDGEQILHSFVSVVEEEVWSDSLVFRAEYAFLIYKVGMGIV